MFCKLFSTPSLGLRAARASISGSVPGPPRFVGKVAPAGRFAFMVVRSTPRCSLGGPGTPVPSNPLASASALREAQAVPPSVLLCSLFCLAITRRTRLFRRVNCSARPGSHEPVYFVPNFFHG